MPPLPEPAGNIEHWQRPTIDGWSADQMHAYARTYAAELERRLQDAGRPVAQRCPTCGVGIRFDRVDSAEPPRLEAFLSRKRVDEIARATTWFNGSHAMTDYYEFARLVAIEVAAGRSDG